MILKTLIYLIDIRLRKFLPKKDLTAVFIFGLLVFVFYYILYIEFDKLQVLSLCLLLDPIFYHSKRKDLNFLRINSNFRFILFLEYLIYILPLTVIHLLNSKLYPLLFIAYAFLISYMPRIKYKAISLPFNLSSPIWHIYFRKYKAYLFVIAAIIILIMGSIHNNKNLVIGSIFISLLFPIIINLEKNNQLFFIAFSIFKGHNFIIKEIKTYFINLLIFNALFIICYIYFNHSYNDLLILAGIYIATSTVIIFKYYSDNALINTVLFVFFISAFNYGSILVLPYIYYKSLKNIRHIQC